MCNNLKAFEQCSSPLCNVDSVAKLETPEGAAETTPGDPGKTT